MATYNGHQKLLAQLQADGLTTVFGNPGFSEEGLLDGIGRTPAIRYILGLQEAALALMASGYAMATNKPTVLRLLRRCVKIAATPPYGPTLLAVPQDILDAMNDEPVVPAVVPETRVAPEPALIGRAAELATGGRRKSLDHHGRWRFSRAGSGRTGSARGDAGCRRVGSDGVGDQHPVADASVMPTVVSGNCHAAIVMIGEKLADMVKADRR